MNIPKLYLALTIVLILGAGAVGYQFFIHSSNSSSRSSDTLNNQNASVNDSASPRLKKSSPAENPPIKLTDNETQAKGLKQHSLNSEVTTSVVKDPRRVNPVNPALSARGATAASDYSKILDQLNDTKDSAARQQLITNLINSLSLDDPRVAAEIINQIDGKPEQYQFSSNYMSNLLRKNPQEAIAWVESIQDNEWVQKNLYYVLAKELVNADPQALKPWIDSIDDAAQRKEVIDGVAFQWALSDPQAAYQWFTDNVSETEADQAVVKIAQGIAKQDAPAAADWVSQLPEGPNKVEAMRSVAINWAAKDPTAAVQWLKDLPESGSRDQALSAIGGR